MSPAPQVAGEDTMLGFHDLRRVVHVVESDDVAQLVQVRSRPLSHARPTR